MPKDQAYNILSAHVIFNPLNILKSRQECIQKPEQSKHTTRSSKKLNCVIFLIRARSKLLFKDDASMFLSSSLNTS